jgi:sugar phosphate isomerase/epimerase/type 1 glutamine amidotransferase
MMQSKWAFIQRCILGLTFLSAPFICATTYADIGDGSPATKDERAKVDKVLPQKASAVPKESRKLLIFNLNIWDGKERNGHPSIGVANYALERMGKETGAYDVVVSNDVELLRPGTIDQFDAICFNNTVGVLFDDPELRQSLLDYVYGGGGFMGIHAACATFVQWPEYGQWPEFGEMLGAYENGGHPWGPEEVITLKVEGRDHPVNAGFTKASFEISDEVFQLQEPYSRDKLRVLLTIDTDKTDMSEERRILPERRADKDLAISWVRKYGRGRVFYTSLGHNKSIYWNPMVLRHYLDGIQFALGDLEVPTTPSGLLTDARKAQEALGWRLGMGAYTFHKYTLFEALDKTAELGLNYFGGFFMHQVSKDISKAFDYNLSREEILTVRRKLLDTGVSMINYYIHKIPADEADCRKLLEFCRLLGVETIVGEPELDAVNILAPMLEKLDTNHAINLAIHNHASDVSPLYWRPEEVLKVCEGRGPRFGACVDNLHWVRAELDPLEALQKSRERVLVVHLHDVNERSTQAHDVPWGTGKGELDAFIRKVHDLDITPRMWAIEYAHNYLASMPEIEESIRFFNRVSIELAQ